MLDARRGRRGSVAGSESGKGPNRPKGAAQDASDADRDYAVTVGDGADWRAALLTDDRASKESPRAVGMSWPIFAGLPDPAVGDGERGFASEEFVANLARAACVRACVCVCVRSSRGPCVAAEMGAG